MVTEKGSNLPIVKKRNSALIRELIYKCSPISRAQIAGILSLTTPTITTNVAQLIEDNLVEELRDMPATDEKALGRKPVMLDFIRNARYAIGVELGPYQISFVVTDLRGNVLYSKTDSENFSKYEQALPKYEEMLVYLSSNISEIIPASGIPSDKFLGVGIGVPGFIEGDTGVIRNSFRKDWNGKNLARDLAKNLGISVSIENNVRARAAGADLFNKEMDADTFAYYFVSHGIACPLVIRNDVLYGKTTGAGEAGHMVVEIGGPKCDTCGNNGCLEAIASEQAIRKRCAKMIKSRLSSILAQICADAEHPEMEEILKAQECGDLSASTAISDAINYLGVNLANIINLISPQSVIIDALLFASEQNREQMLAAVKQNLFEINNQEVQIIFEPYDPLCGAKGGAALLIKKFLLDE